MLEFTKAKAKVNSVHSPVEFFGDDTRLACHVKVTTTQPNDALAMLHPALKSMLFQQSGNKDMVSGDTHLPNMRFPQMPELAWDAEFSGVKFSIARDLEAAEPIVMDSCDLKGIKLTLKEGGSVDVEFKVIGHPSEDIVGRLAALQQKDVLVWVEQGAIRQEQAKADKREKDSQTRELLPPADGAHPFPTDWEPALKLLKGVGFNIPEDDIKRWSGPEVKEATDYCKALDNLKDGKAPPKVPQILKGRPRSSTKAARVTH